MAEEKYQVGRRFNSWTVLAKLPVRHKNTMWRVICDCGKVAEVSANNIYTGKSKACRSCGAKERWKKFREGK